MLVRGPSPRVHAPPRAKTGVYAISRAQSESVHCPNARFVAGRVAACRDAVGKVPCLLVYFGTPCLGHVASRCAARAGSPRSSVVLGRSSTL